MAERRAKGLCMFCDEPYALGHHLKHKKAQLFIIEGDEDEDAIIDESVESRVETAQAVNFPAINSPPEL